MDFYGKRILSSYPHHIAIVMDGNGRWAERQGLARVEGHGAGVEAVRRIVKACLERHIPVLSLFAFSSENWSRPKHEVDLLMELFAKTIAEEIDALHEQGVRLRFCSRRSKLSKKVLDIMDQAEHDTRSNQKLIVQIALDYGGRWDIVNAAKQLALRVQTEDIKLQDISEDMFAGLLCNSDLPYPDLLIRTSGETRISNFFLWQCAYSELYFTKTLWPDFAEEDLQLALDDYSKRERRYGTVKSASLFEEKHHA